MMLSPQRLLVCLSVSFFFSISLFAQSDAGLLALEKGDHKTAFLLLTAQAEKKKTAVIGHFGLAKLYATTESSYYDLKKANDHGKTANTLLREVKNKNEKEDLKAIGVSSKFIRELRQQISDQAIAKAQADNTPEAYEALLKKFRLSPEQKEALKEAYGNAVIQKVEAKTDPQQANSVLQSYKRQLNRYSSSAYAKGESVVFEKYISKNGWANFTAFKSEFPDNRFSSDNGADAFLRIRNTMDINIFENFTQKYKYSAFTPIAQDSIAEFRRMLADNKEEVTNALATLDTYDELAQFEKDFQTHLSQRIFQKEQAQLEQKLFAAFIEENGWSEFSQFQEKHPNNRFVLDRSAKAYHAIAESDQLDKFQAFTRNHPSSHYNSFAKTEIDRLAQIRKDLSDQAKVAMDQFKQPDELYNFQEKHRSDYSKYAPHLNIKIDRQVMDQYMTDHNFDDFEQFQKSFPNNIFASERIAGSFLAVAGSGKLASFETFVKDHSDNPYQKIALDSIRFWKNYRSEFSLEVKKALKEVGSYEEAMTVEKKYQKKIVQFTPALQEQVDQKLFSTYIKETGGKQLEAFHKKHPNNKGWNKEEVKNFQEVSGSKDLLQYKKFNARYPRSVFKQIVQDSIQSIEAKLKPGERLSFANLQYKVKSDLRNKNWDAALEKIRAAGAGYTGDPELYDDLVKLIKEPERGIARKEMSKNINELGSAYIPIVTADGKTLYFCATGLPGNKGLEDIFVSKKEGDTWGDPQIIDELCTSEKHEAPLSASADGNTLILFLAGKIGFSNKTSKGWSEPKLYSSNINQGSWQCDAIITADGKAMLFTYGGWGGSKDIYVSLKQADGSWGKAKKLNETINTDKDERTPFLHPDLKTLYFSSRGHGGMGGLDVFVSERLDDGWDNWSKPRNLGKEVNTVEEDWGYKISTDGKKAFFAAEVAYSNKIFEVILPEEFRPGQVVTIEGKAEGLDNEESATVVVLDSKTKKEIARVQTEPGTGEYFIVVPKGIEPEVKVEKDGVFSEATKIEVETIGTEKQEETTNIVQNIAVVDFNQEAVEDLSVTFEDVLFETDQFVIKEALKNSLNELAGILAKKELKVTISGYTDDVGATDYNQTLSQNRAEAVKAYLVEKGCKAENITALGYGESNSIASNDTEEGRAKNRRVEFSFEEN